MNLTWESVYGLYFWNGKNYIRKKTASKLIEELVDIYNGL